MWIKELRWRAIELKVDTFALYLATRHPRTFWYAKVLIAGIVAVKKSLKDAGTSPKTWAKIT